MGSPAHTAEAADGKALAMGERVRQGLAGVKAFACSSDCGGLAWGGFVFHAETLLLYSAKSAMQVGPRIAQNKTGEQRPIEPIGYCQKDQNRIYSYS